MITLQRIKQYYELESDIKDISIKSRKRHLVDVRNCYYVSARKFTNKSSAQIGCLVKKDHSSVLYGIKNFNNYFGSNSFTANEIYKNVDSKLSVYNKNENDSLDILNCNDADLLKQYYKLRHIEHTELSHSIINRLENENKQLRSKIISLPKVLINAINELEQDDFNELIKRTELFLKVNRLIKKNNRSELVKNK